MNRTDLTSKGENDVNMTRLNIGTRLGLGFATLIILMLILAVVGLVEMASINSKLHHIAKVNDVEARLLTAMHSSVSQRAIAIRNIVLIRTETDKKPELEHIQAQIKHYKEAEEKLNSMLSADTETSAEEKALVSKIQEAQSITLPFLSKVSDLGMANQTEAAVKVLLEEARPAQRKWLDLISEMIAKQEQKSEADIAEAEATYATGRIIAVSLSLFAVLLGIAIAYFITRSITRPLNEAVTVATHVANGDLTHRIEVKSSDEVGKLMQALKAMTESLSKLILNARENADEVSSAATELATASGQVSSSSQYQSEAASSMAAAIEEMTVSITQISDHANDAHRLSIESSARADEGGTIIHGTISDMQKIAASVTESAQTVQELAQQSEQITGIVNVIKDVAEQTNLLALNAAIEAARAGEQGRGFAVVADEVRKLAERTSQSTIEISSMIGKIQDGIQRVTGSMQAGVERVNKGVDQANRAGESVTAINHDSQRVVSTVNDINAALKEQSAATNEIAKSVERIAQMAEENNAAVEETSKTAQHLEQLAVSLQNTVGRFKV